MCAAHTNSKENKFPPDCHIVHHYEDWQLVIYLKKKLWPNSPVIFKIDRIGLEKQTFWMHKFGKLKNLWPKRPVT